MTDKTQGSDQGEHNEIKNVFKRVMPNRTITGQKTDKPQFPSRMDGSERAIKTQIKKFWN